MTLPWEEPVVPFAELSEEAQEHFKEAYKKYSPDTKIADKVYVFDIRARDPKYMSLALVNWDDDRFGELFEELERRPSIIGYLTNLDLRVERVYRKELGTQNEF